MGFEGREKGALRGGARGSGVGFGEMGATKQWVESSLMVMVREEGFALF